MKLGNAFIFYINGSSRTFSESIVGKLTVDELPLGCAWVVTAINNQILTGRAGMELK
jgi:hypothetical protein